MLIRTPCAACCGGRCVDTVGTWVSSSPNGILGAAPHWLLPWSTQDSLAATVTALNFPPSHFAQQTLQTHEEPQVSQPSAALQQIALAVDEQSPPLVHACVHFPLAQVPVRLRAPASPRHADR